MKCFLVEFKVKRLLLLAQTFEPRCNIDIQTSPRAKIFQFSLLFNSLTSRAVGKMKRRWPIFFAQVAARCLLLAKA